MKEHIGLGARRTIKDTVAGMMVVAKALRGEALDVPKKRKAPVRTKPRNDMIEKELERQIIWHLGLAGYIVAKSGEQSTYNSKHVLSGMSDLQVFGKPFGVVFMEVKQPSRRATKNGGLRESQVRFRDMCEKVGVKYCVVYSLREALECVKA
jgi:hypothetical protein